MRRQHEGIEHRNGAARVRFQRFKAESGCAVLGPGWFVRAWKLRLVWAPGPDPTVKQVVADEEHTVRMTISFVGTEPS